MKHKAASFVFGGLAAILSCLCSPGGSARAQDLLAPVARVNGAVIAQYELLQRTRFLEALGQPGDLRKAALDGLIDDRLRIQAGKTLGVSVDEEQVSAGMAEFAARFQLSTEAFLTAMAEEGLAPEIFRDFVSAGLVWRAIVQVRFGPRVQITEAEIDRALTSSSSRGGVRVLLSEIVIPYSEDREAEARRLAGDLAKVTTSEEFASAARTYSAAPSRDQGGRIDWLPVGSLPPELRAQILTLSPGQVTPPVDRPGAIAIFLLREIEETPVPDAETLSVEYAAYHIPGARTGSALSQAAKIRNEVDTCDDLYRIAQDQPPEVLERETLPLAGIPQDIAIELARLDENEASTALTRNGGDTLVFLMLCGRVTEQAEDASREEIRAHLVNQRLASYADSYLAELRAEADIVYP